MESTSCVKKVSYSRAVRPEKQFNSLSLIKKAQMRGARE